MLESNFLLWNIPGSDDAVYKCYIEMMNVIFCNIKLTVWLCGWCYVYD